MDWAAFVRGRMKAVVAALGIILFYLQAFQTARPNHWVGVAIGVLTLFGVHQVRNQAD